MFPLDSNGQNSLHWVISRGDFNAAKDLIQKMSVDDIGAANLSHKYTSLHLAAQQGWAEGIELLLQKGQRELAAKVDKYGQTALHWCACDPNKLPSARALVNVMNPEDLSLETHDNRYTALHLAAQGNNNSLILTIVEKGGRDLVRKIDAYGQTALHWSVSNGNYEGSVTLSSNMDVDIIHLRSNAGGRALDFAIANNNSEIIALLRS